MKKLLFALLCVLGSLNGMATHELCLRSTEGTEFWFGFMEGRNYNTNHYLQLTVTSGYNASFTLRYGPSDLIVGSYTVAANSSTVIKIDWTKFEAIGTETVENKGLHLVSDNPVNVYALNYDNLSADVAVIYPVESVGQEYFAMCYTPHIDENNGAYWNGRNSEFLIVATADNTTVTITPSVETAGNKPAGVPFSVSLKKGQTYQVQSLNRELANQGDLTGSFIKADKPVSVYSGNLATSIPLENGIKAWDHLYEQMPPLYSWGKEYYAVPMLGREADRYRILASQDGTTVNIDATGSFQLNRGEFKELLLSKTQATRILADKPILVAQFSQSQSVDGTQGDPSMIVLSSTSQSKNNVTFEAYNLSTILYRYINVISLTQQVPNLRIDGKTFAAAGYSFKTFSGTEYSYVQMPLDPGTHTLLNTDANAGFLAYVYGFGDYESFGYGVGFNLNVILDLGKDTRFKGDTLLLCPGDTLTLDPGSYFDTYSWMPGGSTSQTLKVTQPGWYNVVTTISDCPALHDSVYVLDGSPKLKIDAPRLNDCSPATIALRATSADARSFLWSTNTKPNLGTSALLTVDSTATYRVTVTNDYGCSVSAEAKVIIFGNPPVTIQADTLVCGSFETAVKVDFANYPDTLWRKSPGTFNWWSNGLAISHASDSAAVVTAPAFGTWELYYKLTTKDGCVSGDTLSIRFSKGADVKITADRFYDCDPATISLKAESADAAGLTYSWQLPGGKLLGTSPSLDVDSTAWYQVTVTNPSGCSATDTARVIIFGNPPVRIYADTLICGSYSTAVRVDFSTYPDSLWNGGSGGFDWNSDGLTISDQTDGSATVTAPAYGIYQVYYRLWTKDLCETGDTIAVRFEPQPVAGFDFDFLALCKSYTGTLQFTGTATAGATFSWEGQRMQVTRDLGAGAYEVVVDSYNGTKPGMKLLVEDAGCRDSVSKEEPDGLDAGRELNIDFAAQPQIGCEKLETMLYATTDVENCAIKWATPLGTFANDSLRQTYTAPGSYDVTMSVYSNTTGCDESLTRYGFIQLYPEPEAAFEVDHQVVGLDDAWVEFQNNSSFADSFAWNFGDGQQSFDYETGHEYGALGEYLAVLSARSSLGCADSATMLIRVVLDHVVAPNAFRPASSIPENRVFMPSGLGLSGMSFKLQIFDRWGQVIFETTSADNPWTGTDKQGKDAPMGNYIWIARYWSVDGHEQIDKGQILLIR